MTKCHKTVVQTQRGRSSDVRAGISNESIESKCTSNLGSTTLSLWAIMLMLCVCVCVCSAVVCVCVWLHVWMFRISRAGELLSRHWRRTQPFSSAHHRLPPLSDCWKMRLFSKHFSCLAAVGSKTHTPSTAARRCCSGWDLTGTYLVEGHFLWEAPGEKNYLIKKKKSKLSSELEAFSFVFFPLANPTCKLASTVSLSTMWVWFRVQNLQPSGWREEEKRAGFDMERWSLCGELAIAGHILPHSERRDPETAWEGLQALALTLKQIVKGSLGISCRFPGQINKGTVCDGEQNVYKDLWP